MIARNRAAALALIGAGVGFLLFGLAQLRGAGDGIAFVSTPAATVPTATPTPTLSEPILPPPTATPAATATVSPSPTAVDPAAAEPDRMTVTPRAATVGPTPAPTLTEPILPHPPTATPSTVPGMAPTPVPTATPASPPSPTPRPPASPSPAPGRGLYTLQQRAGVCGAASARDTAARLGFGWYLDWHADPDRFRSAAVEYVPMIRLKDGGTQPDGETLLAAVEAMPGALWLIGNEPDVKWQDSVTPEVYAGIYHDLYTLLKARDPSCQVAIGGISQPTPLRLRYLDRILDAYQARYGAPMPVDVWNVHNFILREERDSWGVDIPPGMDAHTGALREIADHDSLPLFRQQIVDFRRWMAGRGQQDKPLIVTEYGILMPAEYGFPVERVTDFMIRTFEFLRTAADPALGYPADGYRLVQRWCWFSAHDDRYPTGNLVRPGSGELTPLGEAFRTYLLSSQ